jgi:hypothetical protein
MEKCHSFRFLDDDLNRQLIVLLKKAKIKHEVCKDGSVRYPSKHGETVENDYICSIRDKVFPSWQVLTCPRDWTACYRDYMNHHGITFQEELSDGESWFLIPRKHRPHMWKLDPTKPERLALK